MKTLRVLVTEAPLAGRPVAWALVDDAGRCVAEGRDPARSWPAADAVEAVLAASRVRIASLALPPLPPSRVAAAAEYAVEDQLAGPADHRALGVSPQAPDGRVRVVVADRALLDALRRGDDLCFARVVAEPDLAASHAGWRWCAEAGGDRDGFVRRDDGSAFPASAPVPGGALPPELALALAQAARDGRAPTEVRVDATASDADLARWQRDAGVRFARGTPWRWAPGDGQAHATAVDLLRGEAGRERGGASAALRRLFVPALALAAAALALHVAATLVLWGALKVEGSRQAGAWNALGEIAGLASDDRATGSAAQAALARRYAELRHRHGLAAPDDALPLLARAAPALHALPAGSVKSAIYVDGHWTLELARSDAAALAELDARLKAAGVPALVASSAAGTRVRLGAI